MIYETGRIIAIENNDAWVETFRTSSCMSCSAKANCGQRLVNRMFAGKRHHIKVALGDIGEQLNVDDQVEIAIAEHAILLGSFWLYCVPLSGFMGGAVAGSYLAGSLADIYPVTGGIVGFLFAAFMVYLHTCKHRGSSVYRPVLHRILHSAVSQAEPVSLCR